ncbi:hypothetical protein [Bounagaea algeriensis]
MLEYYRLSKRETLMTGLTGLGIIIVGGLLATQGQVLFQIWPWSIPVVCAALIAWNVRGTYLAAGADWFQSRRHWVRTYELTSIKYTTKPGGFSVLLQDGQGGRAGCDLHELQSNPALWDLVYNGILHSVASGEVTANFAARRHLPLPDELSTKLRKDNGKT